MSGPAIDPVRIALLQMTSGVDPATNAAAMAAAAAEAAGEGAAMLFTPEMSGLLDRDRARAACSVVPEAENPVLEAVRDAVGDDLVVMADCCLDEFTDHGHCGIVDPGTGEVDNDATVEHYAELAVVQAKAGADVIAPSGMMDGQVAAIRAALDGSGYPTTAVLAYAAKYASALYGPFRDAADVTIVGGGDRKGYQQDPRNGREALLEVALDVAEGADMVMVKPALTYLDVVAEVRRLVDVPVAAYHVSGEYAMVKAAAERGWIDGPAVALEQITAVKRAGADFVLTYFAGELAEVLGA